MAAAGVGAAALTHRRWASCPDPTEGSLLGLPDGEQIFLATRDGAKLAAHVAGPRDGRAVVLGHGWTHDSRIWGPVAQRLVDRGYRVISYDQRGHGGSTIGERGLTLDALAADLDDLLTAIDARDAIVAGHSMGGMSVQAFALNHPDSVAARVAALVIVSSACDGMRKVNRLMGPFTGLSLTDRVLALSILAPFLVRTSLGRNASLTHLHAIRDLFVATPPHVRRKLRAEINAMDLSDRLSQLRVPVVVIAGRRDRITPFARSERIADVLDNAQLAVLDEHGHMLPWEAPDEVADLVAAAPSSNGAQH